MQTRSTAEYYDALRDPSRGCELSSDVGFADWKESPGNVLRIIDGLLERHGLEVVEYDTLSSTHAFKIEPRQGTGPHVSFEELRGILKD